MTITQGSASLAGVERMRVQYDNVTQYGYDLDRYRVCHMPAFQRVVGTGISNRSVPKFKVDWFVDYPDRIANDEPANITISTGPTYRNDSAPIASGSYLAGDFVYEDGNVSITLQTEDHTAQWGNGTDASGDSPPVTSDGHPVVNYHMQLPGDQAIDYGPASGGLGFGFLRFILYSRVIEAELEAKSLFDIHTVHLEEIFDGDEDFSALIGEYIEGNGVNTAYHDSMPINAFTLRLFLAMVDRYTREARYNQTVILGEMYDIPTGEHV